MFRRFLPLFMGFAVFAACTNGPDTNGPDANGSDANGPSDGAALVTTAAPARAGSDSVSESESATTLPGTDASVLDVPDLTDDQWSSAVRTFGWVSSETAKYGKIERIRAIANVREEVIADCMRRDGFEYFVISQDFGAQVIEDPDRPRGTSEWRDRYGFGVTTLIYDQSEVGPEGIGVDPAWESRPPDQNENPNAAIYNGLTEAAQAKYDESYGVCVDNAADEVPDLVQDARGTLAVELEELDERVRALSTYAQLRAEFNECLAEPGLVFEGLDSVAQYLVEVGIEAGYFDEAQSEEQWLETIIEIQTLERDLASRLEKCGGLAEWERRYADLAEPFRREFAATHFELVGP